MRQLYLARTHTTPSVDTHEETVSSAIVASMLSVKSKDVSARKATHAAEATDLARTSPAAKPVSFLHHYASQKLQTL